MTDETKPEAMTAERTRKIRERAEYHGRLTRAGYFARGAKTLDLLTCLEEDVPALLSALEEARKTYGDLALGDGARRMAEQVARAQKAEKERDALAARVAALEQACDLFEKNSADATAVWEQNRSLTARVAELEGAFATARAKTLEEAARVVEDRGRRIHGAVDPTHTAAEIRALALPFAAPPEKAPGGPGILDLIAVQGAADRAVAAAYAGHRPACPAAPEKAPAVQRDFGRLARAARRLIAANHGEIDTDEGQKEGLAAEAEVLALIGEESAAPPEKAPAPFDMLAHLAHQREWSERTFGPGPRAAGVVDHIRKELREIERAPDDLTEWIDVVILALDGAWRSGHSPAEIIAALVAKQAKNERRKWPDWRTAAPGQAIEHVREAAPAADPLCARDLGGGRKCGHPLSEHGTGACSRTESDGFGIGRIACGCPGFVPEPSGVVDRRTDGEPARHCPECDGRGRMSEDKQCEACGGTGGPDQTPSDPARTCGTCIGYGVTCGIPSGVACGEWAAKSGGSTTEGGGTP